MKNRVSFPLINSHNQHATVQAFERSKENEIEVPSKDTPTLVYPVLKDTRLIEYCYINQLIIVDRHILLCPVRLIHTTNGK